MSRDRLTILGLAYVIGLLATGVWGFPNPNPSWSQWLLVICLLIFLTWVVAFFLKKWWHRCPQGKFWIGVSLVAILGTVYFQFRVPQPNSNDISNIFNKGSSYELVTVTGQVLSEVRLTSNQRHKFWLQAQQVQINNQNNSSSQLVTGKVYVTVPFDSKNKLYPGQTITVSGGLYKPRSPTNPGAFDFKVYLARQGAFAGLKGETIEFIGKKPWWGWWKFRQPIIKTFINGLGTEKGLTLSSMVLGRKAVDLPPEIRDLFIKAGLAHVLAASGFHVALLLGSMMRLTRNLLPKQQLLIGISILLFYAGLTGLQPSVFRAVLMGIAVLIGQTFQQKVRITGALLLAAIIILLWNPLWIWDLGFQLSFLATFGLIITVPILIKKLDWLPPAIATLITVPIASSIWILPLLIHTFSILATYSIPTNIITSPLIMMISLGGMASAAMGLVSPDLGSLIVNVLYYPLNVLIDFLKFVVSLPGSSYAIGQLSLGMMLIIYGILILIWLNKFWQRYWWGGGILIVGLICLPIIYQNLTLIQVTILAAKSDPVVVIQDRGKVSIINLGNKQTIKYTILPFLAQQGINHLAGIMTFDSTTIQNWILLNPDVSVDQFVYIFGENKPNYQKILLEKTLKLGSTSIQVLENQPTLIKFEINQQSWLWLTNSHKTQNKRTKLKTIPSQILLWSDNYLPLNWVKKINPDVVISASSYIPKFVRQELQNQGIKLYWTRQDGAIKWTQKHGFKINSIETQNNFW